MTSRSLAPSFFLAMSLAAALGATPRAYAQGATASAPAAPAAKKAYALGDVNLELSRVYIFVGKSGFGHEHAVAGTLKAGRVLLGNEQNAGELAFNMSGFVADPDYARKYIGLEGVSDPSTRQKVTENMLGPDVLNVAKYPVARFAIRSARATGQVSKRRLPVYEFEGDFTLHETTRRIQFLGDVEQREGWARVQGSFTMLQTDYGITPFSKAFGAIGVSDQLTVYGDLWIASDGAAKAGAAP